MKVSELMTTAVTTCGPLDNLNTAAQIMWEHDCGCVPVLDAEAHVLGMLTDRDVCMSAYTRGQRLDEIAAHRAMSLDVVACGPDDSTSLVETRMREQHVRRLPVVDDCGRLVGLVSLNDLAQAAVGEEDRQVRSAALARVGETLAEACAPRYPSHASSWRCAPADVTCECTPDSAHVEVRRELLVAVPP